MMLLFGRRLHTFPDPPEERAAQQFPDQSPEPRIRRSSVSTPIQTIIGRAVIIAGEGLLSGSSHPNKSDAETSVRPSITFLVSSSWLLPGNLEGAIPPSCHDLLKLLVRLVIDWKLEVLRLHKRGDHRRPLGVESATNESGG